MRSASSLERLTTGLACDMACVFDRALLRLRLLRYSQPSSLRFVGLDRYWLLRLGGCLGGCLLRRGVLRVFGRRKVAAASVKDVELVFARVPQCPARARRTATLVSLLSAGEAAAHGAGRGNLGHSWSLGRKARLTQIQTAADLAALGPDDARTLMTVTGDRTVYELRGISCALELPEPTRKGIAVTRSFGIRSRPGRRCGKPSQATRRGAAEKMRRYRVAADNLFVFMHTTPSTTIRSPQAAPRSGSRPKPTTPGKLSASPCAWANGSGATAFVTRLRVRYRVAVRSGAAPGFVERFGPGTAGAGL